MHEYAARVKRSKARVGHVGVALALGLREDRLDDVE
jgi:hypothetical protein